MVDMAEQLVKQREAELDAAQRLTKSGAQAKLQLDTCVLGARYGEVAR